MQMCKLTIKKLRSVLVNAKIMECVRMGNANAERGILVLIANIKMLTLQESYTTL